MAPYYRGRPVWVCRWVKEAGPVLQRMTLVVSALAPSVYATLTEARASGLEVLRVCGMEGRWHTVRVM